MAQKVVEINTSSIADIALLLIIFFLTAASIEKEEGIMRSLPDPKKIAKQIPIQIYQKNALKILSNSSGVIQIQGKKTQLGDIKTRVKEHIDNGGRVSRKDNSGEICDYCNGSKSPNMSDHPKDAVIFIELNRETPYKVYITIQNEIDRAINELRNDYCVKYYNGITYKTLKKLATLRNKKNFEQYLIKLKEVEEEKYPIVIAEMTLKDYSQHNEKIYK